MLAWIWRVLAPGNRASAYVAPWIIPFQDVFDFIKNHPCLDTNRVGIVSSCRGSSLSFNVTAGLKTLPHEVHCAATKWAIYPAIPFKAIQSCLDKLYNCIWIWMFHQDVFDFIKCHPRLDINRVGIVSSCLGSSLSLNATTRLKLIVISY